MAKYRPQGGQQIFTEEDENEEGEYIPGMEDIADYREMMMAQAAANQRQEQYYEEDEEY